MTRNCVKSFLITRQGLTKNCTQEANNCGYEQERRGDKEQARDCSRPLSFFVRYCVVVLFELKAAVWILIVERFHSKTIPATAGFCYQNHDEIRSSQQSNRLHGRWVSSLMACAGERANSSRPVGSIHRVYRVLLDGSARLVVVRSKGLPVAKRPQLYHDQPGR